MKSTLRHGRRSVPRVDRPALLAASLGALVCASSPAAAARADDALAEGDPRVWVAGQLHGAVLSDVVDRSAFALAVGVGASVGVRWDQSLGVFLRVDNPWWTLPILNDSDAGRPFDVEWQSALAAGLGGELLTLDGRLRTSLAGGISFLLRRTVVDQPGTSGFWVELRPAQLRFEVAPKLSFVVDPLTLTLLVPDPGGIPSIFIQFRTMVGAEVLL